MLPILSQKKMACYYAFRWNGGAYVPVKIMAAMSKAAIPLGL
jgi:hypothetical protein